MEPVERGMAALQACCRQRVWSFERIDHAMLVIPVDGTHGAVLCMARVEARYLVIMSLYSFKVPDAKRFAVAELAVRANSRIVSGALVVDLEDGEVAFKTGVGISAQRVTSALAGEILTAHLAAADFWLPGVAAVCFLDISAQAAIRQCADTTTIGEAIEQASKALDEQAE